MRLLGYELSSVVTCKVNFASPQIDGAFWEMQCNARDALFDGNHSFILDLPVYICPARVHPAHF